MNGFTLSKAPKKKALLSPHQAVCIEDHDANDLYLCKAGRLNRGKKFREFAYQVEPFGEDD